MKLVRDLEGCHFSFYVISAAPEEVIQSALEGIVPPSHIVGTRFQYAEETGEIQAILRVPAGYGKANVVWSYGNPRAGFFSPIVSGAQRLPNGNTLISCGTQKRVIEVTPDKQIVWEFSAKDAPEVNLTWASSIQPLKNGNLLIGNFLRGQEGKGAHVFEVTRDKKVVWQFDDHAHFKTINQIQLLDISGDVTRGEIHR